MEFTDDLRSRTDWKTCKTNEATLIRATNMETIHVLENFYMNVPRLYLEIRYWSMYDRMALIRHVIR